MIKKIFLVIKVDVIYGSVFGIYFICFRLFLYFFYLVNYSLVVIGEGL